MASSRIGTSVQLRPKEGIAASKAAKLPRTLSRGSLHVCAGVLTATGPRFLAQDVTVKGTLGEGSYGQVFEGTLKKNGTTEHVVLKRVKTRVEGAEEMGQMELLLNVYASSKARGSIADFMGHCTVDPEEANYRLTPGLWLVWRYEGSKTLAYYLKRRDCIRALSKDLAVPEEAVPATVMKHIFECLTALHNAGVVHRDVKPLNLVLAEKERRFKLIDLGAAADLRNGTNYSPDESILDPSYCPPEQYCLPTSAPHLGRQLAPLKLAISPLLWSRHKPDCFDSFSTGLVLMQLAVPRLRSSSALRSFNRSLQNLRCDLNEWRVSERLPASQTAALDADNGAGWDLAQALLRPRKVEVREDGGVDFINEGRGARLRVFAALKHRFLKQAALPVVQPDIAWAGRGTGGTAGDKGSVEMQVQEQRQGVSVTDAAMSIWRRATGKLFDLESRIVMQAEALDQQTTKIKKLQDDLAQKDGRTRAQLEEQIAKESSALTGMQGQLNSLTKEFTSTAASAQRTLRSLFGGKAAAAAAPIPEGVPTAKLRPGYGGATAAPGGTGETALGDNDDSRGIMYRVSPTFIRPRTPPKPQPVPTPEPEREAANEEEAESASAKAGKALAGAAVSGLYTGLKFTGLAVRVASGLAASIGKDAEKALSRAEASRDSAAASAEPARPAARPTRRASAAFMEMLRGATDPPVTATTATWADVSAQFEADTRCAAIPEAQRPQMFDTFKAALVQLEEARAAKERAAATDTFKALLRELGMTAQSELRAIKQQLKDLDLVVPTSLSAEDQQRIFLEVLSELRAEAGFKTLLESTPGISAGTSWPLVKRKVWTDPRFEAVPEQRRVALFREFKALLGEVEAYQRSQAAKQAEADRAAAEAARAAAEVEANAKRDNLGGLQDEQARLKAEYDRMEAKLRDMEARLKLKEASLFEVGGVAATAARDRHGNVVFKFDGQRRDAEPTLNGAGPLKHNN
ncbi:probable serine/threonine-protein kinase STN8, chloroplastic at N-terminal half [Coccomyxa sp. Obi]|nr:probable serine/threonine-protein kinase STN8, chloroplastic at N-terminal half [Coccomyxa sp. Obi]